LTHLAAPQAPPSAASGRASDTPAASAKPLASPSATSPSASGKAASGGKAVTLQFNDNTLLPLLLGDHDRHLVRIEQALGVRLSCRGNRVAISGDASRVDVAQEMLGGLWRRLERGESVGRAEIEAAIRLADAENDPRLPLSDLPAIRTRRGAVAARSPGQAVYMEALSSNEMVFGVGPAGTGKTYLAVAQAVAMLQAGKVDRIVLSRPAVEAGERLGFLPGDMKEKIDPYLRPLYDALHDMMPADQVIRRMTNGEIEVAPLAFMRGRTLAHCYAILDEAQNTTAMQMKMFLTRMGDGTRMVITGDLSQVDLPNGVRSGLRDALDTVEGIQGIGVVRFEQRDVVRHPLVARIVGAYDQREAAQGEARRERERPHTIE
jgi:phosphate starvation-inducible PhoH-like protein